MWFRRKHVSASIIGLKQRRSYLLIWITGTKRWFYSRYMEKLDLHPPHVVIFPLAVQGHVNSMLKLAELLAIHGLPVTFLNTENIHGRLIQHSDIQARFSCYPLFKFRTISDGLPLDHPRSGEKLNDILDALNSITMPLFRDMIISGMFESESRPPVSCIIADGIYGFAIDIAREVGIPVVHFRTISASCFWAYFRLPDMIEAGEIPIRSEDNMEDLISTIPGMESYLRRRDLPNFCRAYNFSAALLQLVQTATQRSAEADALIFNTFEDLEGPILDQIRKYVCPNIYTIGPLHNHLKTRLAGQSETTAASNSHSLNCLWEVDRSCIAWLDAQPLKSVVYVSFGSLAVLKQEELVEFWYGLVNSGKMFLWVIRPDLVSGHENEIPAELVEKTKERGFIVGWAPQEEVLAHPAIAGFFTHSGWNSTLESIAAGIPMVCWPYFADQQLNSRLVSEVWKLGLDMKDTCDRETIAEMVKNLTAERAEEFGKSADQMAQLARKTIGEGGSSFCNLNRLIEDIKFNRLG